MAIDTDKRVAITATKRLLTPTNRLRMYNHLLATDTGQRSIINLLIVVLRLTVSLVLQHSIDIASTKTSCTCSELDAGAAPPIIN